MDDKLLNPELPELIASQKTFLHDIASPISVSQGMIEIVLEGLKAHSPESHKEIERLEKALTAMQKIAVLIEKNRSFLTEAARAP